MQANFFYPLNASIQQVKIKENQNFSILDQLINKIVFLIFEKLTFDDLLALKKCSKRYKNLIEYTHYYKESKVMMSAIKKAVTDALKVTIHYHRIRPNLDFFIIRINKHEIVIEQSPYRSQVVEKLIFKKSAETIETEYQEIRLNFEKKQDFQIKYRLTQIPWKYVKMENMTTYVPILCATFNCYHFESITPISQKMKRYAHFFEQMNKDLKKKYPMSKTASDYLNKRKRFVNVIKDLFRNSIYLSK